MRGGQKFFLPNNAFLITISKKILKKKFGKKLLFSKKENF
jgi:hypothetical protein